MAKKKVFRAWPRFELFCILIDRWAGLPNSSVKSDESSRRAWPMGGASDTAREICPHILARVAKGRGY